MVSSLRLMDTGSPLYAAVSPHLDAIKTALSSNSDQLTPREHGYIRAVLAYASGDLLKAAEELCNMLIDYPLGEKYTYTHRDCTLGHPVRLYTPA